MRLITFMICTAMCTSVVVGFTIGINPSEDTDLDSKSISVEDSSEVLSDETPSKLQRRSLGLVFGLLPFISPFKGLVACRGSHANREPWGRHHYRHRHHHHHGHSHHYHEQQYPPQPQVVITPTPYPRFSTTTSTSVYDRTNEEITQFPAWMNVNQPTPTAVPSTRLMTTTTRRTFVPPTSTTARTVPDTPPSSSTPRYNDPDNELIYDIDLRYRV